MVINLSTQLSPESMREAKRGKMVHIDQGAKIGPFLCDHGELCAVRVITLRNSSKARDVLLLTASEK